MSVNKFAMVPANVIRLLEDIHLYNRWADKSKLPNREIIVLVKTSGELNRSNSSWCLESLRTALGGDDARFDSLINTWTQDSPSCMIVHRVSTLEQMLIWKRAPDGEEYGPAYQTLRDMMDKHGAGSDEKQITQSVVKYIEAGVLDKCGDCLVSKHSDPEMYIMSPEEALYYVYLIPEAPAFDGMNARRQALKQVYGPKIPLGSPPLGISGDGKAGLFTIEECIPRREKFLQYTLAMHDMIKQHLSEIHNKHRRPHLEILHIKRHAAARQGEETIRLILPDVLAGICMQYLVGKRTMTPDAKEVEAIAAPVKVKMKSREMREQRKRAKKAT